MEERNMMFFTDLAKWVDKFDNYGFRMHLARIEATRFTGEDGKQYFRFPAPEKVSE